MLSAMIRRAVSLPDRPAMEDLAGVVTWSELNASVEQLRQSLQGLRGFRLGVCMRPTARCIAALAVLEELGCDAFLLDDQQDRKKVADLAQELQFDAWLEFGSTTVGSSGARVAGPNELGPGPSITQLSAEGHGSGSSTVTILTSGTSGKPKAVRHTWQSLARPIRTSTSGEVQRWLLCYRPHLYAGLQVLLQCAANAGTIVVDDSGGDSERLARIMLDRRVGFVSATPSYWRRLFILSDRRTLAQVPIVQITLGGEVVDRVILEQLAQAFPRARIVHIYATTELGRCFSVTDGKPGFPERFLDQISADGVEMKIDQGELLVRSANRMLAYDRHSEEGVVTTTDGWTRTGDLVERKDGRVVFIGRRSDLINIGGNKVAPLAVERVIRSVAGVADVRVFPVGSSIAGQLVACQVVPSPGIEPSKLRGQIAERCRESLAGHERPRLITIVDHIDLTAAGKTPHGAEQS